MVLVVKKGFAQALQHSGLDPTAAVADAQAQGLLTGIEVHLQACARAAGLGGIFDQVEQRADQRVAVAQQLAVVTVTLPTQVGVLDMGGRRRLQGLHQPRRRDAVSQRQFAAGKHQHVAHLVLQFMQALLEAPGKALVGGGGQLLISQMTGVDQRGRQRRTDLMRQRSDHPPQR